MKKVVYLSYARLTSRYATDLFVDYLISKGVSVEYWDVVSLVREEHKDAGMISPEYLHTVKSYNELESMLCMPENKNALYVMIISCGGRFTRIFRLLSRHNCRMFYIAQGALPGFSKPLWWKLGYYLFRPLRLINILFDIGKVYVLRRLNFIKPFDIVFAAGKVMMLADQHAVKTVPISLWDYDHYNSVKLMQGRLVENRYAVFLDINLSYHSDHKITGMKPVTPDIYYPSLNQFFGLLEKKYGVEIVIAAHPTAEYRPETYQGRQVFSRKTPELVRDADFVISHHSTSISYAILNLKPIIFVYTNEMLILYKDTMIRSILAQANYINSPIYNTDKICNEKQITINEADVNLYENYKYNYLTSPESEHLKSEEIFFREIVDA